ncbi:MAG: phosphopantetheine adenylyltransferase [Pseudomonadota bacterium]
MREVLITIFILVIAIIHLLPLAGILSVERLRSLYQIDIDGRDMEILMRHRAALFGILGLFFVYAAFTPAMQPIAFTAAFLSLASFFYLSFSVGDYNPAIRRVVLADVIATVCLLGAILLYLL